MKKTYLLPLIGLLITANCLIAQTPYAFYPLDGSANDISGNNFHGNIFYSPSDTTNRFNQPGMALFFDGADDYIEAPADFDFSRRTVIAWFNPAQETAGNIYRIVYSSDNPNLQHGQTSIVVTTNASLADSLLIQTDQLVYTTPINVGQWYEVAIKRSPSEAKFFVNGVLVYTGSNPDGSHSITSLSNNALIGADRGLVHRFHGRIDDVRIYNTDLEDTALTQPYGVTDTGCINYNPLVTVNNGVCIAKVYGVTDTACANYNPQANVSAGICVAKVYGATDTACLNYNQLANINNGSCVAKIYGCTDTAASNYNPLANVNDGSCTYTSISGLVPDKISVQVIPNPFSGSTTFALRGVDFERGTIKIFSLPGELVDEIQLVKGRTDYVYRSQRLSKGIYHYILAADNKNITTGKLMVE